MTKRKFPIVFSPIATVPFPILMQWHTLYSISGGYYSRFIFNACISLMTEPFRFLENLLYNQKLRSVPLPESPVFILGHWRSGTTLLHNVLCRDDQFAYITTYQSVFPNQFFTGRWLFKNLMRAWIPATRPVDQVALSPDFPQEEGLTLCNLGSYSFNQFWYFPRQWEIFYEKFVTCKASSPKEINVYQKQYKKLIAQSLLDQGRHQFISKNPANTGRIQQLLEMFPDAKFIYIHRHPYMVFQSAFNYFSAVMESLQLQYFNDQELTELIFDMYERFIRDYEEQKKLIPSDHLIEIRYDDLIAAPIPVLKKIYSTLQLGNFDKVLSSFTSYINTQKTAGNHPPVIEKALEYKIKLRWQFALDLYGYE